MRILIYTCLYIGTVVSGHLTPQGVLCQKMKQFNEMKTNNMVKNTSPKNESVQTLLVTLFRLKLSLYVTRPWAERVLSLSYLSCISWKLGVYRIRIYNIDRNILGCTLSPESLKIATTRKWRKNKNENFTSEFLIITNQRQLILNITFRGDKYAKSSYKLFTC